MGQNVTVKQLTVKDGLPSSEVYDVLQDSKGFMWFATDNGVVRYDGYEMTTLRPSDGLEDPVVFQMLEDHRGRIWFRTYSDRLFYWEHGKVMAYEYNDLIRATTKVRSKINSIYVDSTDGVWLSSYKVRRVDAKGNLTQDSLALRSGRIELGVIYNLNGKIYSFETDSRKQESAAGDHFQIHTLYINGKPFSVDVPLMGRGFLRAVFWRSRIYLSLGTSIFEYDGISLKKVFTTSAEIISLYIDSADHLWLGYYKNGIERFSLPDVKHSWKPDLAGNNTVTQICTDRADGLWLTTLEGGVFYVPNTTVEFRPYTASSRVKAVVGGKGEVVVASYDESLTIMDAEAAEVIGKKTNQSPVLGLFKDSRGNIWLSTTGGGKQLLYRMTKKSLAYHFKDGMRDFAEDRNGNVWGITSASGCALKKFDSTGKILDVKTFPYIHVRNTLFTDSMLYVASTLGMHVYDTSMREINRPPSLANMKISKILALNDSLLAVGTIGNGLLVVNNTHWNYEKYNTTERLIADNIYSAEVKDNTLWLGTEKGILLCGVDSLIKKKPYFKQFASGDGLAEDKTNFLLLMEEKAWAFSDRGISIVPYTSVHAASAPPEFYFKQISVDKISTSLRSKLDLPYDHAIIEIAFGFLSLRNQNIMCRYRLANDEPWTYTNERIFRFSSLAPGEYHLEVQYSIDNFHWSKVNSPMSLIVIPPWWQRWYTQLSTLIILGCLIFGFVRHRYRSINRQQQKMMQLEFETLERERSRIAKELHDGVATNLSAIKLMVNHQLRRHKDPFALELDEHFLSTIKEIKTIIYGLTPSGLETDGLFNGLRNYVDRLNRAIPFKIELHTIGKDVHKSDIGLLTFRIIQELLSNSTKHSGATHIYIHLESSRDTLNLIFQDNGVGFTFDDTKGHGLANIQSRIKSVKGNMKFESKPNLTSFTISFPLN